MLYRFILQFVFEFKLLHSRLSIYFALGRWAKYCDQRVNMSVCLSVCLFVRLHIPEPYVQIPPNFLYILPIAVAQFFSDGDAIRCVLTSSFVSDVICSHSGAVGLE